MVLSCAVFSGGVCVSEKRSDVLFKYMGGVFFGVTDSCICKSSEDVQTCSFFGVVFVYVLPERNSYVVGDSKYGGNIGVWDWLTVLRYRYVVVCILGSMR